MNLFHTLEDLIPSEYSKLEQFWGRFTTITHQEWKIVKERHRKLSLETMKDAEDNAYSKALSVLTDKVGIDSAKELLRELVRQTYVVSNKIEIIEQGLSHLVPSPMNAFIHRDYARVLFLPFFVCCEIISNQQSFAELFDGE